MKKRLHSVAIIQARMGSSRLPGKVLLDIAGKPMLRRVIERVQCAKMLDELVVATTLDPSDDPLAAFCTERGYACHRGSQFDVLDRYYQAAVNLQAEIVVRITADCPVIDPDLINNALEVYMESGVDFIANRLPPPFGRTYPIGLDIEICSFNALSRAWKEATQAYQREHVMPYLYEDVHLQVISPTQSCGTSGRGFKVLLLNHVPDRGSSRWTVDTPADLEFIREVYAHFGGREDFSWLEILDLVQKNPELARINESVEHKNLHDIDERGNK